MFRTYYIPSNGQPSVAEESHEDIADALAAWLANCTALFARDDGRSVLIDEADGEELVMIAGNDGDYPTGDMAERCGVATLYDGLPEGEHPDADAVATLVRRAY